MNATPEDESATTEISILPDGRICLFGASRQILEILDAIALGDPSLDRRMDCLRGVPEPAGEASEARTVRRARSKNHRTSS